MKAYTEEKAEKFLKTLPVAKSELVKDLRGAKKAAKRIKFPLALKIISPKALHKTEIGGVVFAKNEEELEKGFSELIKKAKQKRLPLRGIYLQEFIEGKEVVIGIKRDHAFGHGIMFGIGGKYIELLRDVTFRVCPITEKEAGDMINELKYSKILTGFRGERPVNINILKSTLTKVSKIPIKHKKIEEMDINPFIINEKTGKIVDARIVFS